MKAPYLGALLCLGLLAACQTDTNNGFGASPTEVPSAFSVAKLTLEKSP